MSKICILHRIKISFRRGFAFLSQFWSAHGTLVSVKDLLGRERTDLSPRFVFTVMENDNVTRKIEYPSHSLRLCHLKFALRAKPDDKNHGAHSNFPLCALKTIIDAKKEFSLPGKNKKFLPFPKLISSSQHPIKRRESQQSLEN